MMSFSFSEHSLILATQLLGTVWRHPSIYPIEPMLSLIPTVHNETSTFTGGFPFTHPGKDVCRNVYWRSQKIWRSQACHGSEMTLSDIPRRERLRPPEVYCLVDKVLQFEEIAWQEIDISFFPSSVPEKKKIFFHSVPISSWNLTIQHNSSVCPYTCESETPRHMHRSCQNHCTRRLQIRCAGYKCFLPKIYFLWAL